MVPTTAVPRPVRGLLPSLLIALICGGLWAATPSHAAPIPKAAARSDFNGDGFDDLAVGNPADKIGGIAAGTVNVLYGARNGLRSNNAELWHQNVTGIPDVAEVGDQFGVALAPGNYNGDAFSDLAIGVRNESSPLDASDLGPSQAGMVHVLYGSRSGLKAAGDETIEGEEAEAHTGAALAAVDMSSGGAVDGIADGFADLAVGAPDADLLAEDGGMVKIHSGSAQDLVEGNVSFGSEDTGARLGAALAGGSFDGETQDLAVGMPGAPAGTTSNAGAVTFWSDLQEFSQDTDGVAGAEDFGDAFGSALEVGDFNGDKRADLAVGTPNDELEFGGDGGSVTVLYGTPVGLSSRNSDFWFQGPPIGGTPNEADFFGYSLAAADFGRSPEMDLAVGVLGDEVAGHEDAGQVHVLYGSAGGLAGRRTQRFNQDSPSVKDSAEEGDIFGTSLGAGRFDKGPRRDLAIGVPLEGMGGDSTAGAVSVLYADPKGLSAEEDQLWHQDSPRIPGARQDADNIGIAIYNSSDFDLLD